jgi:hypothetical protein
MTLLLGPQELKKRLDAVICPVCTERREDGSCGLDRTSECQIATHLDGLLYAAATVNSDRADPYVDAVRNAVCENCRYKATTSDRCDVRLEGHCALDAYLLPVLEVVDDFIAELDARAGAGKQA